MLPQDTDRTLVEQFENYMKEFTVMKTQEAQPQLTPNEKQALSTKIAKFLIAGMAFLISPLSAVDLSLFHFRRRIFGFGNQTWC